MPRKVQLLQVAGFFGGVNYRDDAFDIAEPESPDCLNVRINQRGGFKRRKTLGVLNTVDFSSQAARNIWAFYGNNVNQILVQDGDDARFSTGTGTFTAINPDALTMASGSRMRAATGQRVGTANSERCYIQRNGEQVAWKWDGAAATVMTDAHGAYNDVLTAPAGGKMPKAKYIATHHGFMWHANTVEAGVAKTNRIRWSFPGEHEDYRTNDYQDLGEDDGDVITGIASCLNYLFVFKNRSIWMVTGTDPTNFSFQRLTGTVGAVSQEAITSNWHTVYCFDSARGVYSITPQHRYLPRVDWLWDRIYPKIVDHSIPPLYLSKVVMGWVDNRVWVGVPWGSATVPKRVFVFDELAGKGGAWYPYEYGSAASPNEVGPMLEWRPPNTQPQYLMTGNDCKSVFVLDANASTSADSTAGATTSTFPSYYRTAWYNGHLPGIKKRFRRHAYVMNADNSYSFAVQHFVNYAPEVAKMVANLSVVIAAGAGKIWGTNTWGADNWGIAPSGDQQVVRCMGSVGSAYSVQMLFQGPLDTPWGCDAMDIRFIPRRIH